MSQNDRPHKNRRAYLNDFHQTLSGEYVYTGVTYRFDGSKKERMKLYYRLVFLAVLLLAAGLVTGLIAAPGSLNCFYVVVPYMVSFMASISLIWGLCRMWAGGAVLREYIYKATLDQFQPRGTLTAVSAGCAFAGEIIYVLRNGMGDLQSGMILFLSCQAVVLVCAILWVHTTENSGWIKQEGTAPRP